LKKSRSIFLRCIVSVVDTPTSLSTMYLARVG
jgi:hypothetical protein